MVKTSANDVDTMVDDQPFVLPQQGQEICEYSPTQRHLSPAPLPQTPELRPQHRTPETYPLSGLDDVWLVMPLKPLPAVPSL